MATIKTAAEIKAHLKTAIEANQTCRGVRFDITVRRVETARSKKPTTAWYADVRPLKGKPEDPEACEEAVKDIIAKAQEDLELVLEP